MRKFIKLTLNEIARLYRRNRYVFIVLMLTQTLTVFAFVFFSSTVVASRYEYSAALEALRTYTVHIDQNIKSEEIMKMIDHMPVNRPENARFYFTDGTNNFISFLYPEKDGNSNVGKGHGINQTHIDGKSRVAVAGLALPDYGVADISVGDVIVLRNEEFDVIGVRNTQLSEIPYTTAFEYFDLLEIQIIMPPNLTSRQRDMIVSSLASDYGVRVTPPRSVMQKTLVSLLLPFIACIFIGIFSVLTFVYLQIYMMEKCRYDFSIMKLCGANARYSSLIILCMFIAIFTVSYFLGSVTYILAYGIVLPLALVTVYLFFVFLLFVLLMPNTVRFVRQTAAQELKR